MELAAQTGDEFPAALEILKPYLEPFDDGRGSLFFLYDSDLPKRFPEAVLDLLWAVLNSRNSDYGSPELGQTLDTIKAEKAALELDRRFQRLEAKAMRFA